jgi:hypothetical protein
VASGAGSPSASVGPLAAESAVYGGLAEFAEYFGAALFGGMSAFGLAGYLCHLSPRSTRGRPPALIAGG